MRKTGMTNEVRECLAEMGVTEEVFAKLQAASNHTEGEKLLEEAKEICRKGFRVLAKKYHPDLNQQLPQDEIKRREERFKRLRSVHDSFLESRYRGPSRSNTQMGADNFDPFGFVSRQREQRLQDLINSLRRNDSRADSADSVYDIFGDDLRILQHLQRQERQRKVRFAEELLRRTQPSPPPAPKPKPPPAPPNTEPVNMPKGVWHRNEESCQPQDKTKKKP